VCLTFVGTRDEDSPTVLNCVGRSSREGDVGTPNKTLDRGRQQELTIQLDGVEFSYGDFRVLDGVTGRLGSGVVGLLGVNGAGKTTLLRLLATVTRPDHGKVVIAGADPGTRAGRRAVRSSLGYLPQAATWNPQFTVRELCHYFAWLHAVSKKRRPKQVDEAIAAVGLTAQADTRLGRLSGGQQRRAMIAQAIAHQPSVLILDEPTTGLDPQQRVAFREIIRQLAADRTVILSTHLVEDVAHTAAEVAILHNGTLAYHGTPDELRALAYRDDPGDNPLEQAFHRVVSGSPVG
jgi:ABC-2 type transport system ATP-binding protein